LSPNAIGRKTLPMANKAEWRCVPRGGMSSPRGNVYCGRAVNGVVAFASCVRASTFVVRSL